MEFADLIKEYRAKLEAKHGRRMSYPHRRLLDDIVRCRTPEAGEMIILCPDCSQVLRASPSCGHRNCPSCQNYETKSWIDRQREKLLPVVYFLVTFTVPFCLRAVAKNYEREFYAAMFEESVNVLRWFGAMEKVLGGDIGMTGVLHTNSRKLDYHPHIHFLVPGGAIDAKKRFWKQKGANFLARGTALATAFRKRLLRRLAKKGWEIPPKARCGKWVVNCKRAGSGEPALVYLSRYLYRGVISEKHIIENRDGKVTFRYKNSRTKNWEKRTLSGEDFLWLVIQHVLPRGFRRVRDFGFLHGNAKKTLRLIQLLLSVHIQQSEPKARPTFLCPRCQKKMVIIAVRRPVLNGPCSPP